ncbi:BQ2448_6139 [Microbotryum intermedium]|uniref:BQ2448_6139 protein n=1 Tax=Microbotryum intermedium TaxID=269621 RepID=A0A238FLQ6_9BASI|nr:BQ2448_6139 [Microbotryum intermedium]
MIPPRAKTPSVLDLTDDQEQEHDRASSSSQPGTPQDDSLSTLACPICFGAPVPIAATSCGHVFCAPCLHAALLAGPALTPPPAALGHGLGQGQGAFGRRGLFNLGETGRGARGGRRNGRGGEGGGRARRTVHGGTGSGWGALDVDEDEDMDAGGGGMGFGGPQNAGGGGGAGGTTELDKHCPVCRKPLRGGWGRALRGVILRMEPKKSSSDNDASKKKKKVKTGDLDGETDGIGGSGEGR